MKRLITLTFLPSFSNLGLLLLRLWFGLGLFFLHGLDKVKDISGTVGFMGKMGIPSYLAMAAILTESLGALLLAAGFATRWAALALATNMAVAFSQVHHFALKGEHSGEMAFLYLGAFAALVFTGAGRFSVDAKLSK